MINKIQEEKEEGKIQNKKNKLNNLINFNNHLINMLSRIIIKSLSLNNKFNKLNQYK